MIPPSIHPYRVEPGRLEHAALLPAIELAAATLFPADVLPEHLFDDSTPVSEFEDAAREERLLVALDGGGTPVGFAFLDVLDGQAHLEELDVLPEHGRRGLGRALVEATAQWARQRGHTAVTLTTFRNVPWNAPFYRSAGFEEMATSEIGIELAEIIQAEIDGGLEPSNRVAMRRRLD